MIGIIGGNGVAATNRLLTLIEEKITQNGAIRDCQHPEMIIWQATKAPSRSMYLEGRGPSWIENYIEIGKKLKSCGCTKLAMCCNTAHYAIDELQEKIGLPFFNLLEMVAIKCSKEGLEKVGLMCTDGLRKVGLYEKYFKTFAPEIELVYPDDEYQKLVTLGICNAKNKIRFGDAAIVEEHPYNIILKVCKHLKSEKKVDGIIAGCTDISNVFYPKNDETFSVNYIDSLEVLADTIILEL